ncbi:MAG: hypothetical protein SGPRY_011763, partial [Prymnesium sp.]
MNGTPRSSQGSQIASLLHIAGKTRRRRRRTRLPNRRLTFRRNHPSSAFSSWLVWLFVRRAAVQGGDALCVPWPLDTGKDSCCQCGQQVDSQLSSIVIRGNPFGRRARRTVRAHQADARRARCQGLHSRHRSARRLIEAPPLATAIDLVAYNSTQHRIVVLELKCGYDRGRAAAERDPTRSKMGRAPTIGAALVYVNDEGVDLVHMCDWWSERGSPAERVLARVLSRCSALASHVSNAARLMFSIHRTEGGRESRRGRVECLSIVPTSARLAEAIEHTCPSIRGELRPAGRRWASAVVRDDGVVVEKKVGKFMVEFADDIEQHLFARKVLRLVVRGDAAAAPAPAPGLESSSEACALIELSPPGIDFSSGSPSVVATSPANPVLGPRGLPLEASYSARDAYYCGG